MLHVPGIMQSTCDSSKATNLIRLRAAAAMQQHVLFYASLIHAWAWS